MRKLTIPQESMGNVNRARVYREHGTQVKDLLDQASLDALRRIKGRVS